MSLQDKFENIYEKSLWGKNWKGEGGSGKGDGTSPDSRMWIKYITEFIKEHNIGKIADLGCGDWKFSRFIPWKELGVQYGSLTIRKNPQANEWTKRNINNKYSYHPIAIDKYPLNKYSKDVVSMKTHRYKQIVVLKTHKG